MLRVMDRWARALPGALTLLALTVGTAAGAGPPFADPVNDQSVYDTADVLSAEVEADLERTIDNVEHETGAELVVYTQVDPGISEDENLSNARALIDQWGVGRSGFDDGLVLMVGLEENRVNGRVSLFGGSGFIGAYASEDDLKAIIDSDFVPSARNGNMEGAVIATVERLAERVTPANRDRLEMLRVVNAGLGLIGAPLTLLGTLGFAWRTWKREGDDPDLTDSPSILMAGPPAGMTPPLATVIREGKATQHSINTTLIALASSGRISFQNLDRVSSMKRDDGPDPLVDPALLVRRDSIKEPLSTSEQLAWESIQQLDGGDGRLTRESLWRLNGEMNEVQHSLESEVVRLGWLARMPRPSINRVTGIGIGIAVLGGGAIWLGVTVPMSGAVMLGAALVLGGIGTIGFGRAMSQRTTQGAYVDAMLKAYRRTLRKTMDQAQSMNEVVDQPEVATLADTPDKAVVWGLALGLYDEVAAVLHRGLAAQRAATGTPYGAYYPIWLGAGSESGSTGASFADAASGVSYGSGSVFSGSAMPDIGGMFDALGSVGSTPPSSSSSSGGGGGGFSGGGSSGGGGASGSF
ncbi:hypothetical protein BH23CHL10_BH23CHL10_02890 [soil metagenome]